MSDQKSNEEAYSEGRKEGQNADLVDEAIHGLGDILVPFGTEKEQCRDAGFHKGLSEKK